MDLIALFSKHVVMPIVARREGSSHLRVLAELEKSQFFSPEEIEQLQLERLKKLLSHAQRNCPFYAKRFSRCGFDASDLTSLEDIRRLPILRKIDIQNHMDAMRATNYSDEDLIPNQTGGSTGAPLKFFLDRQRLFSRRAASLRHDRWAGLDIGQKVGILWGAPMDFPNRKSIRVKLRSALLRRQLMLDANGITREKLADFSARLDSFRPQVYQAYANTMYLFARYLKETKVRDYHRPRSIITSAEFLTDVQRALIEEVFECKVYNRYGCRETSIIASECSEHSALHVSAESLYLEFLRGERPSKPGELGRIVVTDLLNYGMPLIRYEIGDTGVPVADQCSCGRGLPLMQMQGGRVTDFLVTPRGKVVSGVSLATYFITSITGVSQAQLIQKEKDSIRIRLVCTEEFDSKCRQEIFDKLREFFEADIECELELVESIPVEPSGKQRFSISELDPLEYLV